MEKNLFRTIKRTMLFLFLSLLPLSAHAFWDWEWTDTWGEAHAWCEECGGDYVIYAESTSEAEAAAEDLFCPDCGSCSEDVNADCYRAHHCQYCGGCIENGEYHDGIYNLVDEYVCYDCADELADAGQIPACAYCHELFGEGAVACDCEYSMAEQHCMDCSELQCDVCGICMVIGGEESDAAGGDACVEHAICSACMENAAAEDLVHCRECFKCDEDICSECGLCESCASYEEHCPECGYCFGDEVQWCADGGEHCIHCCDENDWKCQECGRCTEGVGVEICSDCELCEECCRSHSESEGCEHGYCIASAEYEDHLCPECGTCPQDDECEYCGLCQNCQTDYHCEHELCPDGSDWDDHVCPDCGECFDESELCEYCGLCEDCREHCEHDVCPANDDADGHFICDQCGDCYEAVDRCDICELCLDCCADNTSSMGCDHDLCIESDDFAEHWCYEDDQCLELCQHDADCAHTNVGTAWRIDGNAHWHVCEDCGIALNKAIHSEGEPTTLTAPNAATHTNGTAQVNCAVCNYKMGIVAISYVEAPADGSPYIITQPTDYTGKTNTSQYIEGGERYATFKVKAGGEGLTYHWYEQYGSNAPNELFDFQTTEGAETPTLKVYVYHDDCEKLNYHKYYCVVSNAKGSVTTNTVYANAQHVFGHYVEKDSETHENRCLGCGNAVKSTSKHRFAEWTLVRPATSTDTGLREQQCMDCSYKNTEVIPKVEPDHVHSFDIAKYSVTQHWFVCKCGLAGPDERADHVFDQTEVVTPATETRKGENKLICSACGYYKTVKSDKLPHVHDWWAEYDDPAKGTRGPASHTAKCKGCNEKKTEPHVWSMFENTRHAKIQGTDTIAGKIERYCEICYYMERQLYPYDTWPIMIAGGTAYHTRYDIRTRTYSKTTPAAYATAGQTIIIEYDPKAAMATSYNNKPQKFKSWADGVSAIGEENVPWDGGRSSIDLPRLTFSLQTLPRAWKFTMPDGPATIFAVTEECNHTGNTKQTDRVEPTCTSSGHEPHTLCADCETVLVEGARIPALGHDLPSTPIAGTEVVEYCTIYYGSGFYNYPNEAKHGYTGEFICNRCGETVKSEKTPLRHGLHDKNKIYTANPGKVWPDYQKWVDATNPPTCTRAGYDDDLYCKYCNKLVQKGEREEAYDHEWGDWEVVREATTRVKGMEQRVCERDETHIETRLTDYSGPDYRLKPDKTRLYFEWTYGDPVPSQTITFRSVGRNEIQALTYAMEENCLADASFDGLTLTVTPKDIVEDYESHLTFDFYATDANGETIYLSSPEMAMTCKVKKTPAKYTLTVIDGVATTGTFVRNTYVPDANTSSKLQVRGGVPIRLEPDDQWRKDFLHWEVVEDASNLLRDQYDIEETGGMGPSSSPTYGNRTTYMSANNVTVRAVYKKNTAEMSFSQTAVTASSSNTPFVQPTLRKSHSSMKVTYSSSDESVAKVDANTGAVTFRSFGTTTITATSAETAHYTSATASYTLTLTITLNWVEVNGVYFALSSSNKTAQVMPRPVGKYAGTIMIPATVSYGRTKYNVSAFLTQACADCTGLRKVILRSASVTGSQDAFAGCPDDMRLYVPYGTKAQVEGKAYSQAFAKVIEMGDANVDDAVSVSDVGVMRDHILGTRPAGFDETAADVNFDGSVTITDIGRVIATLLGQ